MYIPILSVVAPSIFGLSKKPKKVKKTIEDIPVVTCLIEMQQEINDIKKGMEHVINYTGDRQISNECIIKLLEARGLTKEQIVEILDMMSNTKQ